MSLWGWVLVGWGLFTIVTRLPLMWTKTPVPWWHVGTHRGWFLSGVGCVGVGVLVLLASWLAA